MIPKSMINRIKALIRKGTEEIAESGGFSHEEKELASAALLVEAARMDDDFDDDERDAINRLLEHRFGLNADETASLIDEAEKVQSEASDLIRFTRAIKDNFTEEERIELIEMLWEVVYADGVLHHYEANLLRRIGGLIYVSDRDRGAARKRVLRRMGVEVVDKGAV